MKNRIIILVAVVFLSVFWTVSVSASTMASSSYATLDQPSTVASPTAAYGTYACYAQTGSYTSYAQCSNSSGSSCAASACIVTFSGHAFVSGTSVTAPIGTTRYGSPVGLTVGTAYCVKVSALDIGYCYASGTARIV